MRMTMQIAIFLLGLILFLTYMPGCIQAGHDDHGGWDHHDDHDDHHDDHH